MNLKLINAIFFLIIILSFSNNSFAENEEVLKLKSNLSKSETDSNKAMIYRDLAFEYASINPNFATLYADSCLLISKQTHFLKGEAAAYNTYGVINFSQSNYSKALEYYFKALRINENIHFLKGISSNYGNIGNAYYQQFDYEMSLSYHQKALQINQEIQNQIGLSNNLSNIGLIYYSKQEFKEALEYYKKSLEINKIIKNETGIAYNLNNIGLVYSGMKEYQKSIEYYNKSLVISTKLNNNSNIANSLESIGNIYLQLKDYNRSNEYLNKSIIISREIGSRNILKAALYDLHLVNENKGKFKESLENLKEYYLIRDSIYNFENNLKMAQLDFKHKEDKKDKEIEFFKMSDDKQKADLKAKSLTIYFSIAGLFLVSLLAFFIFTRFQIKKKSNIELESKNSMLDFFLI